MIDYEDLYNKYGDSKPIFCTICLDSGKIYHDNNQYEECSCMKKEESKPINFDIFDQLDKDI